MTAKEKRAADTARTQINSLFNSNVFDQQASEDAAEQPSFQSGVKADALKELIAGFSNNTKEYRHEAHALNNATKDFNGRGSVKADRGMWRVKGMSTSLKGYQLLGSAWMRRRENGVLEPRGGLLADQMGLGKTLMMLGEYPYNVQTATLLINYSKYRQRTTGKIRNRAQDHTSCCKSCVA
jgi:SNF2 family DNA or RNA helicase